MLGYYCISDILIFKLLRDILVFEGVKKWSEHCVNLCIECDERSVNLFAMELIVGENVAGCFEVSFQCYILGDECSFPFRVIYLCVNVM